MTMTHNGISHVTTIPEFAVWWKDHITTVGFNLKQINIRENGV